MDLVGFITTEPVRTVLAFVAGGLFTAAVAEWRSRAEEGRAERRAAVDRIRALDTERIRQTQLTVIRHLRYLDALAWDAPRPTVDLSDVPRHDLRLVGEEGGLAFLDTFPWLAEWGPLDRMTAVSRLRGTLLDLLDAQERRALSGVALLTMSAETAARVGTRLTDLPGDDHVDSPPSAGR